MKLSLTSIIIVFTFIMYSPITDTYNHSSDSDNRNNSGYVFVVNVSKINSENSEIACTTFRDKLVLVSSKKIGGLGNGIDPNTNEPYTDLFCTDILTFGELAPPMLFSRILNTKNNEGQVSFSPDEHTIYYTRSDRKSSLNYQLYKAELEEESYGNWQNHMELAISSENYSIENPHVSNDGAFLYFSSNMPGGFGGFDLYKAQILQDGTLDIPVNLGNTINTEADEKYPHSSEDGKELFFSSKGHNSIGGFDIFISSKFANSYSTPRNLGYSINSDKDEIGFIFIDDKKGVFSSNKDSDSAFHLYRFQSKALYQELNGIVVAEDDKVLPNTSVALLDGEGIELERQVTTKDGTYRFKIRPYKKYQIKVLKDGYESYSYTFHSDQDPLKSMLNLSTKLTYQH